MWSKTFSNAKALISRKPRRMRQTRAYKVLSIKGWIDTFYMGNFSSCSFIIIKEKCSPCTMILISVSAPIHMWKSYLYLFTKKVYQIGKLAINIKMNRVLKICKLIQCFEKHGWGTDEEKEDLIFCWKFRLQIK